MEAKPPDVRTRRRKDRTRGAFLRPIDETRHLNSFYKANPTRGKRKIIGPCNDSFGALSCPPPGRARAPGTIIGNWGDRGAVRCSAGPAKPSPRRSFGFCAFEAPPAGAVSPQKLREILAMTLFRAIDFVSKLHNLYFV